MCNNIVANLNISITYLPPLAWLQYCTFWTSVYKSIVWEMWPHFVTGECKKSSIFWMLLFRLLHAYFLLFLEPWDKRKVSQRNLYCVLEISVLKNLFPNCMSVILKEHDTVNSTANLSTWRHLTNQSMIPKSGIMERRR